MASRPHLEPFLVYPSPYASPANSVSIGASFISQPTIVNMLSEISYSVVWTGVSPVGAVSVQSSNDVELSPGGAILNPGTWNTLPLEYNQSSVSSIPISGNSGNGLIDIASAGFYAIRFVYTYTSGTGTMEVTVHAKVS